MNIGGPNQFQLVGTDDPSSNGALLKYTHEIQEAYDENDSGIM